MGNALLITYRRNNQAFGIRHTLCPDDKILFTTYNKETIANPDIHLAEQKVFLNHIYEYKKGVRHMVLYTVNRRYEDFATARLRSLKIESVLRKQKERLRVSKPFFLMHLVRERTPGPQAGIQRENEKVSGQSLYNFLSG